MANVSIRVDGLDEFRKGLRQLGGKELGKALGQRNKKLGALIVQWSDRRRSQMASRFPSYDAPVVKIKPSANQRRLLITIRPGAAEEGIKRHPVFGRWMNQDDFVRRVWPVPNRDGWVVRPTVDERGQDIADEYLSAVTDLARRTLGAA